MGKALVTACLLVAACQPMYEKKPERMKAPAVVKHDEPPPPPDVYVDDCDVNFTAPPARSRKPAVSQTLTQAGDSSLQTAAQKPRKTTPAMTATRDAIDKYSQALVADPYNAEATLKLALAYDRVYRKGCALAMLRRLDNLASSPTFEPVAKPFVEQIVQNPHWFSPYHRDALKAVGR